MKRALIVIVLTAAGLLGTATPAWADVTFFLGFSPTPVSRPTRGFAAGINMLVIGFEFDYSATSEDVAAGAPSLKTGMLNGLIMTPTKTQLYLTAGGGFFRERIGATTETSFGTNLGGGVKVGLVGPVQVRVDYRIFNLRGDAHYKHPQRIYAGVNLHF
jgi:hypothetical protein